MKIIYKPIGIVLGILGGLLGKRVFDAVWAKVDDQEPPEATTRDTTLPKLLGAAAMQGVIFKVVRVLVDRFGAKGWEHLTGFWPGEKKADAA
jgi:xanthosine utilization system XapX-like protein